MGALTTTASTTNEERIPPPRPSVAPFLVWTRLIGIYHPRQPEKCAEHARMGGVLCKPPIQAASARQPGAECLARETGIAESWRLGEPQTTVRYRSSVVPRRQARQSSASIPLRSGARMNAARSPSKYVAQPTKTMSNNAAPTIKRWCMRLDSARHSRASLSNAPDDATRRSQL